MYWDVVEIKIESYLVLFVRFSDGTCGKLRFLPTHLTGVFLPLKEPAFFEKVFIDEGVVSWPGEIDLAPDAMYHEIKKHSEWILS
jgi:hypothetical protein